MGRKRSKGKKTAAQYRAAARRLKAVTARDYSTKKRLTPKDKAAITRAANLVARGSFLPIKRKRGESAAGYAKRIKKFQRTHGAPVSGSIRGVVAPLPEGAKRVRITERELAYTVEGADGPLRYRVNHAYELPRREWLRDEAGDFKRGPRGDKLAEPISARTKRGIAAAARAALKGMRRPVVLFARCGSRLNWNLEIFDRDDLEDFLETVFERLDGYGIAGTVVFTART